MKNAGNPRYISDADDGDINGDNRIINGVIDIGVNDYNEFIMTDSFE